VDTEQMKGATVDTMALAVEGSEVVLIGVSRAYKESSNCRMEAQYALQKKKALVPLMMTEGYEADGWLGLLLGTSMWYGFYGETLLSGSAFDGRMDALSRDIGSRGRADAVVPDGSVPADVTRHTPITAQSSVSVIGNPAAPAFASNVVLCDWTVADVHRWLSEVMKLASVADAAQGEEVDGAVACAMSNEDWKELGAAGLKAAKLVAALTKLRADYE